MGCTIYPHRKFGNIEHYENETPYAKRDNFASRKLLRINQQVLRVDCRLRILDTLPGNFVPRPFSKVVHVVSGELVALETKRTTPISTDALE